MEDYDTGETDFNGDKICLQNIQWGNYSSLKGEDRCPNLKEKSLAQFSFRVVLYLVIFTINVILVNILIGQIGITLNRVMIEGDKDYYLNVIELKAWFLICFFCSAFKESSLMIVGVCRTPIERKNLFKRKIFALQSIFFLISGVLLFTAWNISTKN